MRSRDEGLVRRGDEGLVRRGDEALVPVSAVMVLSRFLLS